MFVLMAGHRRLWMCTYYEFLGYEKLVDYAASGIGAVAGSMLAPWMAEQQTKALSIKVHGLADNLLIIDQSLEDAR